MEATLQPIRRFDLDAAIVFSDILLVPAAMGCSVVFDGNGPHIPPLRRIEELDALKTAPSLFEPVYESLSRIRKELDPSKALLGFCGGPWTLACFMTCGEVRDRQEGAKLWAWRDPVGFGRLIHTLAGMAAEHLIAQLRAGADTVQIFESLAGNLTEEMFRDFVVAPTKHMVAEVRKAVPEARIIGFPRQATLSGYERYARETGIDVLSLDTAVPPDWAAKEIPPDIVLQGNLDPLALVAGGEALKRETERIMTAMRGRRHIFNLGHGVLPQTPPEHVDQLMSCIRGVS